MNPFRKGDEVALHPSVINYILDSNDAKLEDFDTSTKFLVSRTWRDRVMIMVLGIETAVRYDALVLSRTARQIRTEKIHQMLANRDGQGESL